MVAREGFALACGCPLWSATGGKLAGRNTGSGARVHETGAGVPDTDSRVPDTGNEHHQTGAGLVNQQFAGFVIERPMKPSVVTFAQLPEEEAEFLEFLT